VTAWSNCSDQCWLTSGNYKTRAVQCLEVAPTGSQAVVAAGECVGRGLVSPSVVMDCNVAPCAGPFWVAAIDWGPCSALCTANATDPGSWGVSTRSPAQCMLTVDGGAVQPVSNALCGASTLVRWGCIVTTPPGQAASLGLESRWTHGGTGSLGAHSRRP
jgi:hypothetical protein